MEIEEITKEEYNKIVVNPFSGFDKSEFAELNKSKVDEVKYLIFKNNKNRFSLITGIKNGIIKCPFSASFSCFSEISHNNRIQHYHDAISSLIIWAKNKKISNIIFLTPPLFFNEPHITKFQNALYCNGFKLLDYDVNFQFSLKSFSEDKYISELPSNSRRNIKQAIKNSLTFEKVNNTETVYKIIKQNRKEKGFPLWMSCEDIKNTEKIIKSDYFLVYDSNKNPIASAYVQTIKQNIANVVYWGNIQASDYMFPMNYLALNVFNYYSSQKSIDYVSIGTSTKDSIPNYGLCDFKESIGCKSCAKLNWIYEIKY